MTIEIEAGASQTKCGMETASVHAVSRSNCDGVMEILRCRRRTSQKHRKEERDTIPKPSA
jgi:hypothetical protein